MFFFELCWWVIVGGNLTYLALLPGFPTKQSSLFNSWSFLFHMLTPAFPREDAPPFSCLLASPVSMFFFELFLFTCHWAHLDMNIDIGAGVWLEVHLFFFLTGVTISFILIVKDADGDIFIFTSIHILPLKSQGSGAKNPNSTGQTDCLWRFVAITSEGFFVNDQWVSMSWVVRSFARFHMSIPEVVFTVVMFFFLIFACSHVFHWFHSMTNVEFCSYSHNQNSELTLSAADNPVVQTDLLCHALGMKRMWIEPGNAPMDQQLAVGNTSHF